MTGLSVPATLAAGQTTTFAAKFSPTTAGSATGSISIVSNAPGSPLTIALSGSGSAGQPQLTISPASVSYGNVSVGSSAPQTITLTNAGNATLTVTQLTASGAGFSVSGATLPLNINASSSASFTATFAPTSAGAASGSMSIVSNAPGSPASVLLSGTGIQGQLGAAPSTVNFGSVNVGSSGSQTITLTNSGTASLTISQATASGTGFSVSGITTPLTLGAGQSTSFAAKFAPTSAGSVSGSVSIVNNGPNSPITVSLSGSGTATAPQLTISPASVSYGSVAVGSSTPQTITLTNSGNATLTVTQATVSGTGFSMSGATMPMNISAGSNASFTATFAPTSAGAATRQHFRRQQRSGFAGFGRIVGHGHAGTTRREPGERQLWLGGSRQQRLADDYVDEFRNCEHHHFASDSVRRRVQHQRNHDATNAWSGREHHAHREVCAGVRG